MGDLARACYKSIDTLKDDDAVLRALEKAYDTTAEGFIDDHQDLINALGLDLDFLDTAETIGVYCAILREGAIYSDADLDY